MLYRDSIDERWEKADVRYAVLCLLVNTACALFAFSFFIIRDGGLLVIGRDFNEQQLAFSIFSSQMVREGMTSWSPQVDIGSGFIGAMSFYNLGSPWFWCSSVLPPQTFPYIVGLLYVTKYAVAGMTSFLFISRYVRNGHSAVLASMLYAFSGFQCSNLLFYHFHDVTALFPLLLIGLDELAVDKKRGRFAFFVFLNVLVNYFFFIGEVFFLILYYVVRFLLPSMKDAGSRPADCLSGVAKCMAEGILGGAMGMALLLPSVLSVLQNSRATSSMAEGLKAYNLIRYLAVIRSVLFPGEMMSAQASLYPLGEWTSCSAYLPGVGLVLVCAFIIGRKKHWLSSLLVASAVIALIPWLNGIFCLYSGWYCRWYYMPLLFAALASAAVIDEPSKYPVRKAAILVGAATIAFVLAVTVWPMVRGREMLVSRKLVFLGQLVISLIGVICTYVFVRESADQKLRMLYALVSLVSIVTTASTIGLYQGTYDKDADAVAAMLAGYGQLSSGAQELIDGEGAGFRVGEKNNNLLTMTAGLPSAGSFCSTVSGSVLRFYEALGLERAVESPNVAGEEYLLSEAYSIQRIEGADGHMEYRLAKTADTYPIGFTYDGYITESELAAIVGEDENETAGLRVKAMLTALAVHDEDAAEVNGILEHRLFQYGLSGEPVDDGRRSSSQEAVEDEQGSTAQELIADVQYEKGPEHSVTSKDFRWNRDGFSCSIKAPSETFAFFSVPDDRGWSAFVNGERAKIYDICGLMAIQLPEGSDAIEFIYRTPGLMPGIVVSAAAWLVWITLIFTRKHSDEACDF